MACDAASHATDQPFPVHPRLPAARTHLGKGTWKVVKQRCVPSPAERTGWALQQPLARL
eukprot:m.449146 g.449146  ORF g.449146 m.449146 type:complete len:59 (-) comp20317_c1_seq7:606-782(-)